MCSLLSEFHDRGDFFSDSGQNSPRSPTQRRDSRPGLRGRRLHRGDSRGGWCNRRATPAAALWTGPGTKADVCELREEASAPMPPMPLMPPEPSPGSPGLDHPRLRPDDDRPGEPRDEPDPDWPDDWPDDDQAGPSWPGMPPPPARGGGGAASRCWPGVVAVVALAAGAGAALIPQGPSAAGSSPPSSAAPSSAAPGGNTGGGVPPGSGGGGGNVQMFVGGTSARGQRHVDATMAAPTTSAPRSRARRASPAGSAASAR